MTSRIPLRAVWVDGQWQENLALRLNENGVFLGLEALRKNEASSDYLIPGSVSSHSHAFHRFFAGDGEKRGSNQTDDFWSWRTAMYKEAEKLTPETYQKEAEGFFSELLSFGITHLTEFHYVHHQSSGSAYPSSIELSERLLKAASNTGLRLCLLPAYYNRGGFNQSISASQRRFYTKSVSDYLDFTTKVASACKRYDQDFGYALHSLRAVSKPDMVILLKEIDQNIPVHIHVSEQTKEVKSCLEYHGKRPVEVFLSEVHGQNVFLVHATHADKNELKLAAEKKANIVICPTTEANLGDGVFPWEDFSGFATGSNLGLGTDANLSVSMWEEIRMFEYSQRLKHRKRTVAAPKNEGFIADFLFASAIRTGMKNFSKDNYLRKGAKLDGVLVDGSSKSLEGCETENLISRLTFRTQSNNWIKQVWTTGKVRYSK